MKCPDCGISLTFMPMQGGAVVQRCFKCGGFWLDSGTANNITSQQLSQWRRISSMGSWGSSGKGVCPADGNRLQRYVGELVPPSITINRCDRCGKWWFPGDSLFSYKPAEEAKMNYFRLWGIMTDMRSILLPCAAVALMLVGTYFSVQLVHQKQQERISASLGLVEFSANYSGFGQAFVVFKTEKPVTEIKYQMRGSWIWKSVPVEKMEGYYVVRLTGLTEGGHYIVSVLGKEYGFTAK